MSFIIFSVIMCLMYRFLPLLEIEPMTTIQLKNGPIKLNFHEHQIYKCITPEENKKKDDALIIGHESVLVEIESIVAMLKHKDKSSKIIHPPNGILLFGPPGTGKTTIAKSLANRVGSMFIHLSPDAIEDKYCGEGLKKLTAVFTLAKKIKPCVIFFDEIDGFMSSRSSSDQTHTNTMKTTFLTSMDSLAKEWDILFIATTNRKNALDAALLRRLDIHLHMGAPNLEDKFTFFRPYINNTTSDEDLKTFIEETKNNSTICDLRNFSKYCLRHYLLQGGELENDSMNLNLKELEDKNNQYLCLQYTDDNKYN
jgi:SpoVK/Ycf46/Vps4 family AAA+-type ATPase